MAGLRFGHHGGRQVQPGHQHPPLRQVSGDLPRPTAHIQPLVAVGLAGEPVEQPAVERLAVELVGQRLGVALGQPVILRRDLAVPGGHAAGQHSLAVDRCRWFCSLGLLRAQQMDPAPVVLSGLPLQLVHQGRVGGRHLPQGSLDSLPVGERVQALGAGAELTRGLRTAQQEDRDQRRLGAVETQLLLEPLVILHHPKAGRLDEPDQLPVAQVPQRVDQSRLVISHDRVTAGGLVARREQSVQRQRVRVRYCPLLLQQGSQHPLLDRVQHQLVSHGVSLARVPCT
jgi:hypothetical protein